MKLSNLNLTVTPAQIDPSYLSNLVKEVTVSQACSQVTFDNLDGNTDEGYILECEISNPLSSDEPIHIYLNNDTVAANYKDQYLHASGTSLSSSSPNTPDITTLYGLNGISKIYADISLINQSLNIKSTDSRYKAVDGSSYVTERTITYPASLITNITKIDLKVASGLNAIGIGSKFKLYKKKLNPALVLTNRYLSNMVEEKRITADCSSVTFTNLDSTLDGDYILEGTLVNNNGATCNYSILPNSLTRSNLNSSGTIISGNTTPATDSTIRDLICTAGYGIFFTSQISKDSLGYIHIKTNGSRLVLLDQYGRTNLNKSSGTTSIVTNITSLTLSGVLASDNTTVGTNSIKAGSVFRLYKTNSASLRPGPGFSAHKNGENQTSITPSVANKITFTSEEWDTHNCYDTTNSKFTPTIAGKYTIRATIYLTDFQDGSSLRLYIYKNGSIYKSGPVIRGSGALGIGAYIETIVDANGSTDYFEAYVVHSSSSSRTISGNVTETCFQAQKIG